MNPLFGIDDISKQSAVTVSLRLVVAVESISRFCEDDARAESTHTSLCIYVLNIMMKTDRE